MLCVCVFRGGRVGGGVTNGSSPAAVAARETKFHWAVLSRGPKLTHGVGRKVSEKQRGDKNCKVTGFLSSFGSFVSILLIKWNSLKSSRRQISPSHSDKLHTEQHWNQALLSLRTQKLWKTGGCRRTWKHRCQANLRSPLEAHWPLTSIKKISRIKMTVKWLLRQISCSSHWNREAVFNLKAKYCRWTEGEMLHFLLFFFSSQHLPKEPWLCTAPAVCSPENHKETLLSWTQSISIPLSSVQCDGALGQLYLLLCTEHGVPLMAWTTAQLRVCCTLSRKSDLLCVYIHIFLVIWCC